MNIKSLLLGSAAALVAVSGARAADAVVAPEPEPVEYVRICDIYGAGFYYIPGTEICLKFGGYVRYDIGGGDLFSDISATGDNTWHKRGRYALRVDARTETELGTLQGKVQINFNWATSSGNDVGNSESMERAWVKLGGFMIGVEDSIFSVWTGYASGVVMDTQAGSYYGPFTTHQISYTFDAGNGFSAIIGVEEGSDGENYGTLLQDYSPYVVGGAKYTTGIFGLSAVGAWDSVEDEFAVKGRIDITPNDMFSVFVMAGWTDDDNASGGNYYAQWGGDWNIIAGGALNFNDRTTFNAQFGYNEFNEYSIVADVNITVVPGFVVTPGIGFEHQDADNPLHVDDDLWGGYLRTQFTF